MKSRRMKMKMRRREEEEEEGGRLAMDEDWLFLRNWRRSNGSLCLKF